MSLLQELVARDDAELAVWAVAREGIDVAAEWADLDDDERDWLVQAGVVAEVTPDVELDESSVQTWKDDWREENGASWPTYELTVTADGMEPLTLTGWHCVGYFSPDASHNGRHWGCRGDDGAQNGTPRVDGGRGREWVIESGDNVGGKHQIPCWKHDGRWVTLNREELGDGRYGLLADAADEADHGSEPTWEDVTWEDVNRVDEETPVWVIRDGRVESVDIYTGGVAGERKERWDRFGRPHTTTTYGAQAWSHELAHKDETVWETRAEVIADLKERADDEVVYDDEPAAQRALARRVWAEWGDDAPDGTQVGYDDYDGAVGMWIDLAGDGSANGPYYLDETDIAAVGREGWSALMLLVPDAALRSLIRDHRRRELAREAVAFAAAIDPAAAHMPAPVLADWLDERVQEPGDRFETLAKTLRELAGV